LSQYILENEEIGVNICPPIETDTLLDSLLLHGRSFFEYPSLPVGKYLQARKSEYILKAYNKAAQQEKPGKIFRWEIKFMRMRQLSGTYHILTVADLLDKFKLQSLSELLVEKWNEVIMADPTIQIDDLSANDNIRYERWTNPKWWRKIDRKSCEKDINKFSREIRAFKTFTKRNSGNTQDVISNLIREKIDFLLNN
jgi:hypothetical protein